MHPPQHKASTPASASTCILTITRNPSTFIPWPPHPPHPPLLVHADPGAAPHLRTPLLAGVLIRPPESARSRVPLAGLSATSRTQDPGLKLLVLATTTSYCPWAAAWQQGGGSGASAQQWCQPQKSTLMVAGLSDSYVG
jgi:hypothetical protein